MARTPLFSRLQRCLSLALHADRAQPAGELVELARERRLNRRRFLAVGGALAVASWAPRTVAAPLGRRPGASEPRIAIVGAGIAGLTCAYRLEQAGLRAKLFDSWDRIGGRMFTARGRFRDDQVAELGGELIDTGHEALRGLAQELGLRLDPILEEPGNGIRQDTWFFPAALPPICLAPPYACTGRAWNIRAAATLATCPDKPASRGWRVRARASSTSAASTPRSTSRAT